MMILYGALPHAPLKELFAKSSLRILKKLYKKYDEICLESSWEVRNPSFKKGSALFSYVLVFSQTVNFRVSLK